MKLIVTHMRGSKALYTFDSISRTKGTFDKVVKECTVVLNGASIVQYIELTQSQHNTFVDKAAGGQESFALSFDKDGGLNFDNIPAFVAPTLAIKGSSAVSFEQGSNKVLEVEFTGECVDFTPKTTWTVENGNIQLEQTSNTTASITSNNSGSGTVAVALDGTDQVVKFNITVNPLTPPNITAVGETTVTMAKGTTSNITIAWNGGSSGYVAVVDFTSNDASVTVEKLSNTTAKLTGVSAGSAIVKATINGTNKEVSYNVTVSEDIPV